jgi:hypothetical protein
MAAGTHESQSDTLSSLARQLRRVGEELDVILCESHQTLVATIPHVEQTLSDCANRLQESATLLESEIRHAKASQPKGAPTTRTPT